MDRFTKSTVAMAVAASVAATTLVVATRSPGGSSAADRAADRAAAGLPYEEEVVVAHEAGDPPRDPASPAPSPDPGDDEGAGTDTEGTDDTDPDGGGPATSGSASQSAAGGASSAPARRRPGERVGLLTGLLDPAETAWHSLRNQSSGAFAASFDQLSGDGHLLVDIEVDEVDGQQRVSSVWQRNTDERGWYAYRGLTHHGFHQKWSELRDAGYVLIDQESYVLDGSRRYAGVWVENREGVAWASYRNVTSAEFSARFDHYASTGFVPIDVEAYPVGGSVRYAAVWVENVEDLDWRLWRGLSADQFQQKFDELGPAYRQIDMEPYQAGDVRRRAAIWIENPNGRYWYQWHDLTGKQFSDHWERLLDEGYRVVDIELYPTSHGWRYAGIWHQNSDRPAWQHRQALDQLAEGFLASNDLPGASIAVAHQGRLVYTRGFGHADLAADEPATARTLYRLASVSKALAGILGMRLVDAGAVDLGASTESYVGALPGHHTHTVGQLLTGRSCVRHYEHGPSHSALGSQKFDTALEAAEVFWDDPLVCEPGDGYVYSTHAYTLAGAAFEATTGMPVAGLVDQHFAALGVPSIRAEDRSVPRPGRAALYRWLDGKNAVAGADDLSWKVLGGGIEGSARDLAVLGAKLLDGEVMSDAARTAMWTPPSDGLSGYAHGWSTGSHLGREVVAKDGRQLGAKSYWRIYPDDDLVIVVLTNRGTGDHDPRGLAIDIATEVLTG